MGKYMTVGECISIVDSDKPNQYSVDDKIRWLNYLDGTIYNDVILKHVNDDDITFYGYTKEDQDATLLVPSPYDIIYVAYLSMKIDEKNGETARYNNSAALFNNYLSDYKLAYNRLHMPIGQDTFVTCRR